LLAISIAVLITLVSVSPIFMLRSPPLLTISVKPSEIEIVNPAVTKGNITGLAVNQNGSEIAFVVDGKSGGSLWIGEGFEYASTSMIAHSSQEFSNEEWSSNGNDILYIATTPESASLHVINPLTYDDKKIISLSGIQDAQWSPNNGMIVFSGFSSQGWNLYITNTQTWSTKQITTNGNDEYPSWSSNSSTILFSRSYNGSTSIMADSLETGTYSSLLNYSGIDIWPTEGVNGTLAFESNSSGSWTIVTDKNGTMTDILRISAYYTGTKSPTVNPQWPLIWASQGKEMFFVGLNIINDEPAPYTINFTGEVLAPTHLGASPDKQVYSTSEYHLAVVSQVASNSSIPLIVTAWNQEDHTLFAITPGEPLSFVLVQVGPSSGVTVHPNPYG
jgi:Tol biopolymer transport system component